ncbi:hypothetical protein [Nitrosopumilus sp.]|uniref:hypothetical protein n=1 Tax=Nitrosopumilus sp. TaxID=2024843 RepID=UPI00292EC863|nr:hypothetical protein [Nitrosopumilus sp.]
MTSQNLWNGGDIKKSLPSITELLNIRIFQDGKIIGVYHLPDEVIVRPGAQRIEIHDTDGSLIKTYDLIEKYLSLLDNQYTGCSEIVVDLYVKI